MPPAMPDHYPNMEKPLPPGGFEQPVVGAPVMPPAGGEIDDF
jgi:hypothetical protein